MVVKYGIIWWFHGISRGYFMSLFHGIEWWSNRDFLGCHLFIKDGRWEIPVEMELSSWENLVSTDLPLLYYRRVPQKFSFEWVEWWKNHRWIWGPIFGAPVVRMFMSDFGHLFEIYQYRGWSGNGLEKVQIFVKLKTRPADWITPWLAGWVCPRQYCSSTWWRYLEWSFHSVHCFFPSDFIMNLWYATVPVLKSFHICC